MVKPSLLYVFVYASILMSLTHTKISAQEAQASDSRNPTAQHCPAHNVGDMKVKFGRSSEYELTTIDSTSGDSIVVDVTIDDSMFTISADDQMLESADWCIRTGSDTFEGTEIVGSTGGKNTGYIVIYSVSTSSSCDLGDDPTEVGSFILNSYLQNETDFDFGTVEFSSCVVDGDLVDLNTVAGVGSVTVFLSDLTTFIANQGSTNPRACQALICPDSL